MLVGTFALMLSIYVLQYVCNMQFAAYAKNVRGRYIYNMYRVGRCHFRKGAKGRLAHW